MERDRLLEDSRTLRRDLSHVQRELSLAMDERGNLQHRAAEAERKMHVVEAALESARSEGGWYFYFYIFGFRVQGHGWYEASYQP